MISITATRTEVGGHLKPWGDRYAPVPTLSVSATGIPDRVLIGNQEVLISDLFTAVLQETLPDKVQLPSPYNSIYNINPEALSRA